MFVSLHTLNLLSLVWIGTALLVFPLLMKVRAPYGRHVKKTWGPLMPNRLGWFIMELPSFLIILYFYTQSVNIRSLYLHIVFLLWLFHYFHRTFIFPFMTRTRGKKIPIVIVFQGVVFNVVNAFLNGAYMSQFFDGQELSPGVIIRLAIGLILFALGMYINIRSDYMLIALRRTATNGYKVPRGWLFEYVSCPNYFGEMLEWLGFAILAWNLPALSFFVWTVANLLPRALSNHRWYYEHFPDYPSDRKAVIPFIL